MKHLFRCLALALGLATAAGAHAQYYEIANQLPGLISPALQGGLNYKGYVEASGLAGFGGDRANFLGIATSQGFKYADWFFMGVGIGVDVAIANQDFDLSDPGPGNRPEYWANSHKTKCMIPVFTDFRFNIGNQASTGFFIDLKLGAAWLVGNGYLRTSHGAMNNSTHFYLRPTLGVRIPIDSQHTNRAFNIGVTYQLLTSNNNWGWNNNSLTLNNVGVTVGYEW